MNNLVKMSLGRSTIDQNSIGETVDQEKIEGMLLKNISLFEDILKKKNDKTGQEIFDYLKKK